jgi:hypothetical protein
MKTQDKRFLSVFVVAIIGVIVITAVDKPTVTGIIMTVTSTICYLIGLNTELEP